MPLLFLLYAKIYIEIYEISILLILAIIIVVFVFLLYNQYYRRLQEENNLRHQQELQFEVDSKALAINTQEEERKRIARTLHDELGNKLQVLKLNLNSFQEQLDSDQFLIFREKLDGLIDTTREISHRMYPVNLEYFGLVLTLEEMESNLVGYDYKLFLLRPYTERPLSFEVQVYRIILEFVNNTIKHAHANKLLIYIRDTGTNISFLLKDNGRGFSMDNKKGMGLSNMNTRVELLNGKSKLSSSIGKGTRLIMVFSKHEGHE